MEKQRDRETDRHTATAHITLTIVTR